MPTPLRRARRKPGATEELIPADKVVRSVDNRWIVTLTPDGLYIGEAGRRRANDVGPLPYERLFRDGVQLRAGLTPIKPRKPRARGNAAKVAPVSRGLLSTMAGR